MLNWFKRQRALAALDERKRSSAFGEKSRSVRMALSTIGTDVYSLEKEIFVAESAAAISRFEASAALSLAKLLQGRRDLGSVHDRVIDEFYVLAATKPAVAQSIHQNLDAWIDQPTRGNLDSLLRGGDKLRAVAERQR